MNFMFDKHLIHERIEPGRLRMKTCAESRYCQSGG